MLSTQVSVLILNPFVVEFCYDWGNRVTKISCINKATDSVYVLSKGSAQYQARTLGLMSVFLSQTHAQPYIRCVENFTVIFLPFFSRNPTADDNAFWVLSGLTVGVPIQLDSLSLPPSLPPSQMQRIFEV